jgi:hypothetical protein
MNKFSVNINTNNPYCNIIKDVLMMSFPTNAAVTSSQMLDAITTEIIATSSVRFGPTPNPESLVAIRSVIKKAIKEGKPIPILMPWGSKKPTNDRSIDVGELMGLKTIYCLDQRIRKLYPVGIDMSIRIEDLGGFYLFRDEGESAYQASIKYVNDLMSLIYALGLNDIITPVKESLLASKDEYFSMSDSYKDIIYQYLTDTDNMVGDNESLDSWRSLVSIGWKGNIPMEQRQFYYQMYQRIYNASPQLQRTKLAEYLAGALSRYKLNARGSKSSWGNDFIDLTFVNPIPGAPESLTNKRIYYRTMSAKYTRDHMPPWRGRGYLRIHNDNTTTPAITSFNNQLDFSSELVELSGNDTKVDMLIDYVLMS